MSLKTFGYGGGSAQQKCCLVLTYEMLITIRFVKGKNL